jgi:hypothetical protein
MNRPNIIHWALCRSPFTNHRDIAAPESDRLSFCYLPLPYLSSRAVDKPYTAVLKQECRRARVELLAAARVATRCRSGRLAASSSHATSTKYLRTSRSPRVKCTMVSTARWAAQTSALCSLACRLRTSTCPFCTPTSWHAHSMPMRANGRTPYVRLMTCIRRKHCASQRTTFVPMVGLHAAKRASALNSVEASLAIRRPAGTQILSAHMLFALQGRAGR